MNFDFYPISIPNYTPILLVLGYLLYVFTYNTINEFGNLTDSEDIERTKFSEKPNFKLRITMRLNYLYFYLLVIFWHLLFYDFQYSLLLFFFYLVIFIFFKSDSLIHIGDKPLDMHHIFKMIYASILKKEFVPASQMEEGEFGVVNSKTIYTLSIIFLIINIYCTYNIIKYSDDFYPYMIEIIK